MPRATKLVASRKRRKKILKAAKGYFGARSKVFSVAKNAVDKGLQYAYRDRRNKKRSFRSLWITRINAAARQHDLNYSTLMHLLQQKNITLDRKVLADLALNHPEVFGSVVEQARKK